MHEQGGDATGVTTAGVAQAAVHVAVEEQLHDGEAGRPPGARLHRCRCRCVPVGPGEVGDPRERPARRGDGGQGSSGRRRVRHVTASRVGEEVAEGGDGGRPHQRRLGVVARDPGEEAEGGRTRDETHRLDQTGPGLGVALGPERGHQSAQDGIRSSERPRLEGALPEHPRKAAAGAAPDQRRDASWLRGHAREGLDGVLGHVGPVVGEEGDEVRCRARAALGTEGAHRGDGGDRVGITRGALEQGDAIRAAVAGDVLEPLTGAQPLEDGA